MMKLLDRASGRGRDWTRNATPPESDILQLTQRIVWLHGWGHSWTRFHIATRPVGGHCEIPTRPGLGVGAFTVEVAKARVYNRDAFLPMWSEVWAQKF